MCPTEAFTCFKQQTGNATTCDVVCHTPVQACTAGDTCCPYVAGAGGASCAASTDSECKGTGWRNMEINWANPTWAANTANTVKIYGMVAGDSVLFTTCTPDGQTNTSDSVIKVVDGTNNTVLVQSADDTTDAGALPRLAGWNCTSTAAAGFPLSTAPANPGGLILGPNAFRIDVTVGGKNGAAGTAKLFLWWNGTSTPGPG